MSTAIFVFTKTGHGGTDKVWFYDMTADGFSLDDKRTPVSENDIEDIISRFKNSDGEAERKEIQIIMVPLAEQNAFAKFFELVDKSKVAVQKALDETKMLFDSLMQEYFG